MAHPGFFIGMGQDRRAENRGWRPIAGGGWRRGCNPLPTRSGERCKLPSGVWAEPRSPKGFSTIFNIQDGLSWHYNIVNYWGLSCSHRGVPCQPPPPCVRPSLAWRFGVFSHICLLPVVLVLVLFILVLLNPARLQNTRSKLAIR